MKPIGAVVEGELMMLAFEERADADGRRGTTPFTKTESYADEICDGGTSIIEETRA